MSCMMINGVVTDYVNALDRGLAYGDGLFETIVLVNNQLQFWQQHIARMQKGADSLNIFFPGSELFFADVCELNDRYSDSNYVVKLMLTRGQGERGYGFSNNIDVTRIVMLSELSAAEPGNIEVSVCKHRLPHNPVLAGIKHLNRLDNVLAKAECGANDYEGLMLDSEDNVIEGTMSNVFAVSNGQLYTPGLERCGVHGIIRDQIIDIAQQHGITITIDDLSLSSLVDMDELFICNSLIGIVSARSLQQHQYKSSEMAHFLRTELKQRIDSHAKAIS